MANMIAGSSMNSIALLVDAALHNVLIETVCLLKIMPLTVIEI
jgi:hypothetical protein